MARYYEVTAYGKTYRVTPYRVMYRNNGTLAVILETDDKEPYATVTVNLCDDTWQTESRAFVDVENCGDWVEDFLVRNNLAKPYGMSKRSGRVAFPLYEFNLSEIPRKLG